MQFPDAIAQVLGQAEYRTDQTGKSDAQVLIFEEYVLKIRPEGSWDTRDVAILRYLQGRLPVPRVAAHAVADGQDWLLMTRVHERMLCDAAVMQQPALLMDCMAEACHSLWSLPAADCPFVFDVQAALDEAERWIEAGRFSAEDCEPETFGPGGFESPQALLRWLRRNQPPVEPTATHGDFCLPNLFTDGSHFTGMIDVGHFGLSDRWRDLALGWRSLKHNSDGRYGSYPAVNPDDLFRALGMTPDRERLRYYLLLDELF